MNTLLIQLRNRGLKVSTEGIAILAEGVSPSETREHLSALAAVGPAEIIELATVVQNKATEKHHVFLDERLLSADYASSEPQDSPWGLRRCGGDGSATLRKFR